MTNKEASEVLWWSTIHLGGFSDSLEAIKIAREALEKQIPKKPIRNGYICCPNCDGNVMMELAYSGDGYEYKDDFCPHCGQAIDWSEE